MLIFFLFLNGQMSGHDLETDFNPIDELDPSLGNGYRVIYDREVFIFIKILVRFKY